MAFSYDVTDVGVIRAPRETVWRAFMTEFAGAKQWWLPFWEADPIGEIPAGQVGNRFRATVHPPAWWRQLLFTPRFTVLVTDIQELEHIHVEFPEGNFRGTGTFEFTTIDDNETRVSFRWNVSTFGFRPAFTALFVDIGAIHSLVVEGGYRGLNQWLAAQPSEHHPLVPQPHFSPAADPVANPVPDPNSSQPSKQRA